MKKSVVAVALTGALGVVAHAATVSEFGNGVLIPRVIDQGINVAGDSGNSTAIGLTSCANGTVHWTFFDPDTKHVLDDSFSVTANQQVNLVWNTSLNPDGSGTRLFGGQGIEGQEGYLVFILDTNFDRRLSIGNTATNLSSDVPCLAGAAFQIDLSNDDAAFVPALPLNISTGDFLDGNVIDGVYIDDLVNMNNTTVAGLYAGADANDVIYLRYFLDGGAETDIYIWSAQDLSGSYTVFIYDTDQNSRSLTMTLPNAELNHVDPEGLVGRPAAFVDGFITWRVPSCQGDEGSPREVIDCAGTNADYVRGVVSWSVITSAAIGATQSIVNPILHYNSGVTASQE